MGGSKHFFSEGGSADPSAERRAFEALFRSYFRKLCHFAYQLIRDESLAKDFAQDAFVTYWRHRHDVTDHDKGVRNFLYTTVRNACLNSIRHNKVVQHYLEQQDPDPREEFNVIQAMVRSEVLTEIYSAIESLPESCRRISRMGYLEGLKNKEIASQLGVSVNTVKTQKQRALQLLRARLDPKYFFFLF